jgi:hypothetical protein
MPDFPTPGMGGGASPPTPPMPQGPPQGGAQSSPPSGGSKAPLLQMILTFLAGVGIKPMSDMVGKVLGGAMSGRGAKGGDPNRPHQGGVKVQGDPSNPGGVGATPSAQGQGTPNMQQILQLLAMLKGKQGGQGGPQG